jgi:hypothetical protein
MKVVAKITTRDYRKGDRFEVLEENNEGVSKIKISDGKKTIWAMKDDFEDSK